MGRLKDLLSLGGKPRCAHRCGICGWRCIADSDHKSGHVYGRGHGHG